MTARLALAASASLLCLAGLACTSALKEPPAAVLGGATVAAPAATEVDGMLRDAEAALARRPDADSVERARGLFLAAARADETRVEGLIGAERAYAWQIEHEADARTRQALATAAVQTCQWCTRRAPDDAECLYRLALALGQQARERPATASDGLARMVELLTALAARAPDLDEAGPDRVLALVLLRAPGWPAGPGDAEAGLAHARAAAARRPEWAPNQLVLGEALAKNGAPREARAAYERARSLALEPAAAGDPDAHEWLRDAERALARAH